MRTRQEIPGDWTGGGSIQTAAAVQRLEAGNENVTIGILGDSTGNEGFEWVYLLALFLGFQYPAYTVLYYLWNDGTQAYDTAITLQVGTGSKTLSIYNGSTPGQIVNYSVTRLVPTGTDQLPVTPQVVIVNYGYNQGTGITTPFRYQLYDLTRRILNRYPGCGILVTLQPPVGSGAAIVNADHMVRSRVALELCMSENYGPINVLQAFLDNPDWLADWISPADQLHPNAAGQRVWFELVKEAFSYSRLLRPRASNLGLNRIQVPLNSFLADEGAPVYAKAGASGNAAFPAWEFDQTTQAGIVTTVDYPDSWQYINVYLTWAYASTSCFTSGNNGVMWEVSYSRPAITTGPFQSPATDVGNSIMNAWSTASALSSATNVGAPWASRTVRVVTQTSIASRPLGLRVRRLPGNVNDTMAESAFLKFATIERAG